MEPWFGFDYAAAPLPPALLQGWSEAAPAPALQLPQPNAFIASDLSLVCDAQLGATPANGSSSGVKTNGTAPLQVRLSAWWHSTNWQDAPELWCTAPVQRGVSRFSLLTGIHGVMHLWGPCTHLRHLCTWHRHWLCCADHAVGIPRAAGARGGAARAAAVAQGRRGI